MIDMLLETDLEYTRCFAVAWENEKYVRFRDDTLPDMYSHNFIYLKAGAGEPSAVESIMEELELAGKEKKSFIQVEAGFPIGSEILNTLPVSPLVSVYDYMSISTGDYIHLHEKEGCRVSEAVTEDILRDGMQVDIIASSHSMGRSFAEKRIDRKARVYRSTEYDLNLYVCYLNGEAVGKCELFIGTRAAKLEDFDILEGYQRRGLGTAVLRRLLEESLSGGLKTAYVVTDSEDTAKDMYEKCGFKKVGEKTVLFFKL